jgi:CRISPR-associated protein Cas2
MARRRYLVAYDIREARRLRRVHHAMKAFGYPLQYSVFICDLDVSEKVEMRLRIGEIIRHNEDSVALVDLGESGSPSAGRFEFMGATRGLPEGGSHVV